MSYLDPLITEIEQFLEAFDKGDKIIDTEKGQYDYEKTEYNGKITNGGTLADNLASAISLYKQYKNSTTPIRQIHIIKCKKSVD